MSRKGSGNVAGIFYQVLAKINPSQVLPAALTQVSRTVLKAGLDKENGNLMYSVDVKTSANELKDVKVDAGGDHWDEEGE
jgi:uncharacterized membrane protein YkoI